MISGNIIYNLILVILCKKNDSKKYYNMHIIKEIIPQIQKNGKNNYVFINRHAT